MFRQCFALMLVALSGVELRAEKPTAEQHLQQGQTAYDRGALPEALTHWQQAAQLYDAQHNLAGRSRALVNLGGVYQALGQQRLALETLEEAMQVVRNTPGQASLPVTRNNLGVVCGCLNQFERAEKVLRCALKEAREQGDTATTGNVWNNLGNLLAGQNKTDEALAAFAESLRLAQRSTNQLLSAKAAANSAAVAARAQRMADAQRFNALALKQLADQPATHDVAWMYLRCGQTSSQLGDPARAAQSYERARTIAEKLGDKRTLTYALGYLGQLREAGKDWDAALALTRQAVFAAQEIQLPDAMYRWEWQIARLLRAQGHREAALAAYRRAVETLRPIRYDLLLSGNSFRETVGPIFFELTDLLLQKADASNDPAETQRILREARDTVEQLQSVELEDYLQDECMNLLRAKAARVENIGHDTAVVYIISLTDRTELLVGIGSEWNRVKVPVGSAELAAEVRALRIHLGKRTTNEYLTEARSLYRWLITPIRELLETRGIHTLVFVPDGALRTIPMAALQDGEKFLIEQFAVAVSPGLTLLAPQPTSWPQVRALQAGLAEAAENRPPLPYVAGELGTVEKLFGGPTLLDRQFVWPALQKSFAESQYQLVHFATHGQIDRDVSKSYILTHDGTLTLNQLEALLRPNQFRGRPTELLTLSACQTAAGDDRAALGLAGLAVKAGARSALATLWFVHDESTALLTGEFYAQLKNDPTITKARALQLAQQKVRADPRFDHPGYWSPYLLIGNWL